MHFLGYSLAHFFDVINIRMSKLFRNSNNATTGSLQILIINGFQFDELSSHWIVA